jgi:hypothetical protein
VRQTLSGWIGNALDQLRLLGTEPLTWIVLAAAVGFGAWRLTQRPRRHVTSVVAYAGAVGWLLATLAITIYPIDVSFEPTPWERFEVESVVPLAGTIDSLGNLRDRTWSPEDHAAMTAKLAADLGIPPEEVNLSWEIHGTSPAGILRDPLGNLFLFLPLGLLLAVDRHRVSWRQTALLAAAISGAIEVSQLVLGLGSLGSVDDVIFNTLGALVGFGAYRLVEGSMRRARRASQTRLHGAHWGRGDSGVA